MNLLSQRRLAAQVMGCGGTRVKFNTERLDEVAEALTKDDIRSLVKSGAIIEKPVTGISRGRARTRQKQRDKGRRKGSGRRSGTSKAGLHRRRSG